MLRRKNNFLKYLSSLALLQITLLLFGCASSSLSKNEVVPGMNYEQVRQAWGLPDEIYVDIDFVEPSSGMRADEQWLYKWTLFSTNKSVQFYQGLVVWVEYDYK